MHGQDVPDIFLKYVIILGHVKQLLFAPPVHVSQVTSHLTQVLPPASYHPGLQGHELFKSSYLLSVKLHESQLELLAPKHVRHV